MQQVQQMQAQQSLIGQAGQLASSPLMDASKDPEASDRIEQLSAGLLSNQSNQPSEPPE